MVYLGAFCRCSSMIYVFIFIFYVGFFLASLFPKGKGNIPLVVPIEGRATNCRRLCDVALSPTARSIAKRKR